MYRCLLREYRNTMSRDWYVCRTDATKSIVPENLLKSWGRTYFLQGVYFCVLTLHEGNRASVYFPFSAYAQLGKTAARDISSFVRSLWASINLWASLLNLLGLCGVRRKYGRFVTHIYPKKPPNGFGRNHFEYCRIFHTHTFRTVVRLPHFVALFVKILCLQVFLHQGFHSLFMLSAYNKLPVIHVQTPFSKNTCNPFWDQVGPLNLHCPFAQTRNIQTAQESHQKQQRMPCTHWSPKDLQ